MENPEGRKISLSNGDFLGMLGCTCDFTYKWDGTTATGMALLKAIDGTPVNIRLNVRAEANGLPSWQTDMKPTAFEVNAPFGRVGIVSVVIRFVFLSLRKVVNPYTREPVVYPYARIMFDKGSLYSSFLVFDSATAERFQGAELETSKMSKALEEAKLSLGMPFAPLLRYKGVIPKHDHLHYLPFHKEHDHTIAPMHVKSPYGKIPQYAPTVYGVTEKYDPPGDCRGLFMSSKFQANNNCYNYATNVATNSFAQPGRMTGNMWKEPTGEDVSKGAVSDGLQLIGDVDTISLMKWLKKSTITREKGHLVALLISKPYDKKLTGWRGDYHWVRCDNTWAALNEGEEMQWSQKDGGDQVTIFDFAGFKITAPRHANWFVNQGPMGKTPQLAYDKSDFVVHYEFYAYMFVPGSREICII